MMGRTTLNRRRRWGNQTPPYGLVWECQRPGVRRERIAHFWPQRHRPLARQVIRLYIGSLRVSP